MAKINPVIVDQLEQLIILQNAERLKLLMQPSFIPHPTLARDLGNLLIAQLQQKAAFYGHVFCDNLERTNIIQAQITKERAEIPGLLQLLMHQRKRLLDAGVC